MSLGAAGNRCPFYFTNVLLCSRMFLEVNMLYGLFFLLGVFTTKFLQILLRVEPLYKLWKIAEIGFLKNLLQSETLRHQSLAVVKLCYAEAQKEDEFEKVEEAINKKFAEYQEVSLRIVKKMLPYETNYSNTKEAVEWLTNKILKGEMVDG